MHDLVSVIKYFVIFFGVGSIIGLTIFFLFKKVFNSSKDHILIFILAIVFLILLTIIIVPFLGLGIAFMAVFAGAFGISPQDFFGTSMIMIVTVLGIPLTIVALLFWYFYRREIK